MKKTTVTLLILLFTTMLFVPNTFAQQVVTIPDANLRAAVREALNLAPGEVITSRAMLKLTVLDAPGRGITDLTGLEYAINLKELHLGAVWVDDEYRNNPIFNLAPLAALAQLEWLTLHGTGVSDVGPLAALTQLKLLNLSNTGVSDVGPLATLTQLRRLYLADTGVWDAGPLAALTQLEWLQLTGTDVLDVGPLAALTQLEFLYLGGTGVSDVGPLAALTQLRRLYLNGTGVSDVGPLATLTQLEELDLQNCPLNAAAHQTYIPTIQANGTEVRFDPFPRIQLPRVPWLVSLIYFRPSDRPVRPNVDAEIDGLIKKAQRFFADQLELHGFGRKTFQFETDAHGNAVVHHVNGKFPNAHYQQNRPPWSEEIDGQIYVPPRSITVHVLDSDPDGRSFTGAAGIGSGWNDSGFVAIEDWSWGTLAHELAHAFGLQHDWRSNASAKRILTLTQDPMLTSFCTAEWLSVHPAFNPGQAVSTRRATIKMLPSALASPPNTIGLRFEVTDRDGLHQAQLQIPDFLVYSGQYSRMLDCKRLSGIHGTVEFLTTGLGPEIKSVTLSVIDARGNMSSGSFPIDVPSLLPPAKIVTIPDPNLAAAVRKALGLSSGEAITTHAMLGLYRLEARNLGIRNLSGLEHAVHLTALYLDGEYVSGEGSVNSNAVSDFSPLEKLTQLGTLYLSNTGVSDVGPLAALTQLEWLALGGTGVSDVGPLATLTQLEWLELTGTDVLDVGPLAALAQLEFLELSGTGVSDVGPLATLTQLRTLALSSTGVSDVGPLATLTQLRTLYLNGTGVSDVGPLATLTQLEELALGDTDVSDVSPLVALDLPGTNRDSIGLGLKSCPLSYASLHTHIPALQAKGIEVEFDNVAHPALLKTSGDGQEGAGGEALPNPFVLAAMDEHGKPIVGKTVRFDILAGGGMLSAQTATTDAQGRARVILTLGSAAGVNKVKATAQGIQSWVLFTAVGTESAPRLVADVNGDGVVDLADLAIVAQAMGKPVENPRADVNGDGVVDGEDFAQVAADLGEGEAAAPSQAPLPAGLTLEKVEWALNLLHAENTGSPAFRRGIAKLEGFLALLIPDKTLLLANYPNPFNPETWIPYQLANPAEVTVTIYAANGAVVRTLDIGHRRAGSYASRHRAAYWDGRNAQGEPVASGVYFYTLTAGDFAATRKMLILK